MKKIQPRTVWISLFSNLLFSSTILPLIIPPFGFYTPRELLEVLLWQGIGLVGWPIGLLGGAANILLGGTAPDVGTLLLFFTYPALLVLLIISLRAKRSRWGALISLHILLGLTFVIIWVQVLNGYDFMLG
ncbi:MAG: hypothetical protein WBB69_03065 [Anaerolineales bacterium]